MNHWIEDDIAVATTETQDVITGKLVSIEPLGIVIATTTKSKAAKRFEGLMEETDIELFIPFMKIRLCCRANFKGIS